jgi:hypothetical protein
MNNRTIQSTEAVASTGVFTSQSQPNPTKTSGLLLLGASLLATAIMLSPLHAFGEQGGVRVSGSGIAVFEPDFQTDLPDADIDGSLFGFNVVMGENGAADGNCRFQMAGVMDLAGAGPQVLQATVTGAVLNGDGTVTLSSEGYVHNWKGVFYAGSFKFTVGAGGAGVGTFQATIHVPEWGDEFSFPVQTVISGQIKIR